VLRRLVDAIDASLPRVTVCGYPARPGQHPGATGWPRCGPLYARAAHERTTGLDHSESDLAAVSASARRRVYGYAKWSRFGTPVVRSLGPAWMEADGEGGRQRLKRECGVGAERVPEGRVRAASAARGSLASRLGPASRRSRGRPRGRQVRCWGRARRSR
jgi:hypothetical protein